MKPFFFFLNKIRSERLKARNQAPQTVSYEQQPCNITLTKIYVITS